MVTRPEFQDFIKLLLGQAGGGSAASGASQGSVGGARKTDEWIQLMAVPVLINLLLSRDMDWNPFTLAHRAFRRWAAIPTRVKEPAYRLRRLKPTEGTLEKMIHAGEQKLIEFEAPPKADFEILDDGPRLNWAQARLLMYELKVRDCSGSFSEFFSDPEVQWGKIQADFNNFLTTHPTLRKSSDVEQVGSAKAVFDEIRDLRTRLSYLMAFLLVWNNQREEGIWADLDEIGVKTDTLFSPNPIPSLLTICVTLVLAVLVGVSVTGLTVELVSPLIWREIGERLDLFTASQIIQWGIYSLLAFLVPINFILIIRYINYIMNGIGAYYTLWLGLSAAVAGFFTSVFAMAAFTWSGEAGGYGAAGYGEIVMRAMIWGFAPSLLCAVLTWKLLSIHRIQREVLLGNHNVTFNEPPRRAKPLLAQQRENAALLKHDAEREEARSGAAETSTAENDHAVDGAKGMAARRGNGGKNSGGSHIVLFQPLSLALRFGAIHGLVVGGLMLALNFVPTLDMDREQLFPGAGPKLQDTLVKFAIFKSVDEDLYDRWVKWKAGGPPLWDQTHLDHAVAGFIETDFPANRGFSVKFQETLGLTEPRDRADAKPLVKVQIFITSFLVGFLLMMACEVFNIGLKPETVSSHRKIDTRKATLHQAFEDTA